jgi:hypothetical protein
MKLEMRILRCAGIVMANNLLSAIIISRNGNDEITVVYDMASFKAPYGLDGNARGSGRSLHSCCFVMR